LGLFYHGEKSLSTDFPPICADDLPFHAENLPGFPDFSLTIPRDAGTIDSVWCTLAASSPAFHDNLGICRSCVLRLMAFFA